MTSHPYFCPSKKISTYQIAFFLRGYEGTMRYVLLYSGFTKLHIGLVALVKKISVLINFLLQNTNLCPNFANHDWQDWWIPRTLIIINYPSFAGKFYTWPIYLTNYIYISVYCIGIDLVWTMNNICMYNI